MTKVEINEKASLCFLLNPNIPEEEKNCVIEKSDGYKSNNRIKSCSLQHNNLCYEAKHKIKKTA